MVKAFRYRGFSGPCFTVFSPNTGKYEPRRTPYLDTFHEVMNKIDSEFGHLLRDLNQPWISAETLVIFADVIHAKGATLNNTWGFIDGTVHPIL